jgi:hypothetical protein
MKGLYDGELTAIWTALRMASEGLKSLINESACLCLLQFHDNQGNAT